jgi:hypothetical protein
MGDEGRPEMGVILNFLSPPPDNPDENLRLLLVEQVEVAKSAMSFQSVPKLEIKPILAAQLGGYYYSVKLGVPAPPEFPFFCCFTAGFIFLGATVMHLQIYANDFHIMARGLDVVGGASLTKG